MEKGAIQKISQDTQNENIAFIDEDASNGNVRNFLFNILFIFYFLIGWAKEILFWVGLYKVTLNSVWFKKIQNSIKFFV